MTSNDSATPETHHVDHEDAQAVAVPRWVMLECAGDARDAMVLSQILYWLQPPMRGDQPHRTRRIVERDGYGWMWMTDGDLAEQLGMTRAQVQRARRALMASGLIVCKSAKVDGDKVTLVRPVITGLREIEQYEVDGAGDRARSRDSGTREDARSRTRAVPIQKETEEKIEPPPSPPAVVAAGFATFYAAFPLKMKPGDAEKAWQQMVVRGKVDPDTVVAAAERYAAWLLYLGEIGAFVPATAYPASWLRARRWEDELTVPKRQEGKPTRHDRNLAILRGALDETRPADGRALGAGS